MAPRFVLRPRLTLCSIAILAGLCWACGNVAAQSLLPNGSFEDGHDAPGGWHALTGGTIGIGQAHRGRRCLHGKSSRGEVVWSSEPIVLRPQRDYRFEGWIRCAKGEARLSVELVDEAGRAAGRAESPRVQSPGWRYVAVEWNAANAPAGRVSFWVNGEADLDDVSLALVETTYIGNKGVENDERGRIPFWSEERSDTLLPGRRGGELKPDADVKREGKTSARLTPTNDWSGVASVSYPVAPWTDRLELSCWTRCEPSATAQILACWTDDSQNVLRVDASPSVQANDWQRIVFAPESPPAKAMAVRLVAVARGGPVWFDDFELLRLRGRRPRVQVFVNQIGYDRAGPKSVVIASNFFPTNGHVVTLELVSQNSKVGLAVPSQPERGAVRAPHPTSLSASEGKRDGVRGAPTKERIALKQSATCAGRIHSGQSDDWGWYFWRADFSHFREPGTYRVVARLGSFTAESAPFRIGRNLLLTETAQSAVDFFYIQRCGFEVPGWHKACHLDDAKLPDGTHLDATGGWHSAGDYNKLMYEHGDGGVVYALLTAYDSNPIRFGRFDRDRDGLADALDEASWGGAFVAKMQIPETDGLRNHVNQGPGRNWTKWSAPEVHTDNMSGNDDDPVIQPGEGNSPLVIAGWARLSAILKSRAQSSSRRKEAHSPTPSFELRTPNSDYLQPAVRLWSHATKGGTDVGSPYLLISTIELHRATGEPAYLDSARRAVDHLLSQQATNDPLRGAFGSYGDTSAAALAQFALSYSKEDRIKNIERALNAYITFCVGTTDNAFGVSPQSVGETNSFFPPDLGNNFQVLSRAWAAALVYQATRDPRALAYAQDHVDWVLGKNPLNLCMFEGKGAINPPRYHHRYNTIPGHERGAVPGTIPNGFVRDMGLADRPGFDLSRAGGRAPSFRTSEPWLVHNLFYLLAASALDRAVNQ